MHVKVDPYRGAKILKKKTRDSAKRKLKYNRKQPVKRDKGLLTRSSGFHLQPAG